MCRGNSRQRDKRQRRLCNNRLVRAELQCLLLSLLSFSLSLSAQLRSNQQLVSPLLPFLSFEEAHAIFCKRNSHLVSYHYLVSCQWTAMKPLHTQKNQPHPIYLSRLFCFLMSCFSFLNLYFTSPKVIHPLLLHENKAK